LSNEKKSHLRIGHSIVSSSIRGWSITELLKS
jgi:hypothetical protein